MTDRIRYRLADHLAASLIALSTLFFSASAFAASDCPDNFVAFADTTETLSCTCTPEATDRGSVWGMDVYTGDSSICRAARHAGIITKKGGAVSVVPEPGRSAYAGVTRNGVESINYAAFASSFRFAGAVNTSVPGASPSGGTAAPSQASVCPDNFVAFADTTEPLTCTCAPDATDRGSVWGMDIYTGDSDVCKAARHAGAVSKSGGTVSVIPEPGRNAYAGVTRNGVASNNYGAFASSFRFAKTDAGGAQSAASTAPAPAQVSVCPDNFVAFADSGETLACICQPDAMDRGSVWGMDVYTGDSGICKAARHAGVIGAKGGTVSVISEPGRKAYAGVTRNGVASNNYGPFASSFRFAQKEQPVTQAPPPPAPVAAPVQQPIAATLRERGEVALYIRFRTGSADLDPATVSVLEELLAALKADNALNLGLIGHTDAVGGRDANKTLSYRRAEAVRFWLADHGISAVRIAVDGRGFDEPLADNATEQGRALNRRVQAKKM